MQSIIDWLERALNLTPDLEVKLLSTLIIIVLLWLTHILIVQLINHLVSDVNHRYHWRKTASYIIGILALFLVGRTWLVGIQSLATYLGLLSAGVAIALQKPLTSLAGWVFIMSRRPFETGDRIQIGQHAGDVIDIGPFKFSMLEIGNWVEADQSTGRILHIPNGDVFNLPLANYTDVFNFIWHEMQLMITFESNWEKAKVILQETINREAPDVSQSVRASIKKMAHRYPIWYKNLTPIVYTRINTYGVQFTIRYLCQPRQRRSTEQTIWEAVLRAFRPEPDIEFAYPTQRFFRRDLEDKPMPRPEESSSQTDTLRNGAEKVDGH
jgi:small-conductance mechanosensitive channel